MGLSVSVWINGALQISAVPINTISSETSTQRQAKNLRVHRRRPKRRAGSIVSYPQMAEVHLNLMVKSKKTGYQARAELCNRIQTDRTKMRPQKHQTSDVAITEFILIIGC